MDKLPAIIPARGGSGRITRKNLATIGGVPLVVKSIRVARAAKSVSDIWVMTEDAEITEIAISEGAKHMPDPNFPHPDGLRLITLAQHAMDTLKVNKVVMLQCTSPFTAPEDIDECVQLLEEERYDCVFTVAKLDKPIHLESEGRVERDKPRDVVTGGVYVLTRHALMYPDQYQGRYAVVRIPMERAWEIDTPWDLAVAKSIAKLNHKSPSGLSVMEVK
jgi:CMP-N-acetylneuraminic acid synthetase